MAVTPDTLSPAAEVLYAQVEHLEIGDPESGLSAEDCGWPWATVCAALAAPIDPLFELVAMTRAPWESGWDLTRAPDWILPWLVNFAGVGYLPIVASDALRARLLRADSRRRGTVGALVQAAQETLSDPEAPVIVFERAGGDAYLIAVRTYVEDTPDPTLTEQRIRAAKAGGLVLAYEVAEGQEWAQLVAHYDTWAEVVAHYGTWNAVDLDSPA